MVPAIDVTLICNTLKEDNMAYADGIDPVIELPPTSMFCTDDSLEIVVGTVPIRLFLFKYIAVALDSNPMEVGIVPVNAL